MAIDRAGIVGEDGETHQGVFDAAFLNGIPGVTIFAPSYYDELEYWLEYAVSTVPLFQRYDIPGGKAYIALQLISLNKNRGAFMEKCPIQCC